MTASLATTTVCIVLAFVFLSLRLYARIALVRNFGGDDYLLTGSFVSTSRFKAPMEGANLTVAVVTVALHYVPRWLVVTHPERDNSHFGRLKGMS